MPSARKDTPSDSFPVRWKFTGIISLFVAAIAGIFLFTFLVFESQKSDALLIDLAGRQRMLHQRHMNEILLLSRGHAADPEATRKVLRRTLSALIEGGGAWLTVEGPEVVTLPPAPTRQIAEKLLEQRRLTETFAARADEFLRLSRNTPADPARLEELLALNGQLHDVSNEAVRLFDAHSEAKLYALISLEIVVALLVGFVGVLLTRRVMRASQELQGQIHERRQAEEALQERTEQLETITASMSQYLETGDWGGASARILRRALDVTESEYGFAGVVVEGPALRILALEGMQWDVSTNRAFYEEMMETFRRVGHMEFPKLDNLFGKVITTGKTVISNDPAKDPWSGGVPAGHPALHHFLGVPIRRGGSVVGIIGVANRSDGYTGLEEKKIAMLTHAAGVLYESYRQREREAALENARREAEAALRESEEKLRTIIESSTDAIMLKDVEGRYLVINAAGASFLGRPIADIIGKRDHELFDQASAEAVMAFDRRVMQSRAPVSTEERLTAGDRQRWFYTSKVPYMSPEGQVLGLIGVAHDITERKLTEQALIESREKLHRIADAIPGAVYQYTLAPSGEQRFLYFSRGVQELLGVTAREVVADFSLVWTLTHPDDASSLRASIDQSAQTLRPWSHEFRVVVDGRIKWIRGSSVPEQPRSDGTIVWNGILADITERKHAEEELRKSKESTIAALRQSDTLKSALLSSVSHELRTPLAAIKAMVSSGFKRGAPAAPTVQEEFFEAMNQEVDYLNRLVDNLLDMSRIEAGAMIPQREWQLLDEIVEGAIRRIGSDLKGRPLEITLDEDLPPIHVDAVEMQQVLINLLDNAIKYSPAHSPVRLAATRVEGHVEVRVSNAGPGVSAEDRTRIFERFFRASTGSGAPIRGTGLGLAICKGIVEAHGGRIQCHSVAGGETVMTFTIPLASQSEEGVPGDQPYPARSRT